MGCQELIDFAFQNQLGMDLSPVVYCANKRKKKFGVLQRFSIEYTFEGTERLWRIWSLQEHVCGASKDGPFLCAVPTEGRTANQGKNGP
jgi:hypothetical protein